MTTLTFTVEVSNAAKGARVTLDTENVDAVIRAEARGDGVTWLEDASASAPVVALIARDSQ